MVGPTVGMVVVKMRVRVVEREPAVVRPAAEPPAAAARASRVHAGAAAAVPALLEVHVAFCESQTKKIERECV
jgi:hypothetical protein